MCTFAVSEVIQYYLNNSSDVFVMFLDASKAFDRVEYVKLFGLLRKNGLCPLLISYYYFFIPSKCCELNKVEYYLQYYLLSTLMNCSKN